ncbi:hypothetical protein OH76DRAFT_1487959 [Lentinus brumalis]|uniref:Catalase core domain-containing protein n=1 Tax=Lentinus brumalis TaxID=2498619 RepID=A0A371CSP9_9APHY|nr:hypothetical protein OH76DRAFT_1487959 [Polyporus brumalis]
MDIRIKTGEGNLDWVFNHTPLFFIRDPAKFAPFVHAQFPNAPTLQTRPFRRGSSLSPTRSGTALGSNTTSSAVNEPVVRVVNFQRDGILPFQYKAKAYEHAQSVEIKARQLSVFAAVDHNLSDRIADAIGMVQPLTVKPAEEALRFRSSVACTSAAEV